MVATGPNIALRSKQGHQSIRAKVDTKMNASYQEFYQRQNESIVHKFSMGLSPLLFEKHQSRDACIMESIQQLNSMISAIPYWKSTNFQKQMEKADGRSEEEITISVKKVFDDLGLLLCKYISLTKLISILAESDDDIRKCGIIFKLSYCGLVQLDEGKRYSPSDERDTDVERTLKANPVHTLGYTGVSLDDFRCQKRIRSKYHKKSLKGFAKTCVDLLADTFHPHLYDLFKNKQKNFGIRNDDDLHKTLEKITLPKCFRDNSQTIPIHWGFGHWRVVRDFGELAEFDNEIKKATQGLLAQAKMAVDLGQKKQKGVAGDSLRKHNKTKQNDIMDKSLRKAKNLQEVKGKSCGDKPVINIPPIKKRRVIQEDAESESEDDCCKDSKPEGENECGKDYEAEDVDKCDKDSEAEDVDERGMSSIAPYTIEQLTIPTYDYIESESTQSESTHQQGDSSNNAQLSAFVSHNESISTDESSTTISNEHRADGENKSQSAWSKYYINQLQTTHFISGHHMRAVDDGDDTPKEYPEHCTQSHLQALHNVDPTLALTAHAQKIKISDTTRIQDIMVGNHVSKYSKVYVTPDGHWVALTKTHYIDGESVYNVLNWVLADYFLRTINDRDNVLNDGGKWPKWFAQQCLMSNCMNQLQKFHCIDGHRMRAVDDGDDTPKEYPEHCTQSHLQALHNVDPTLAYTAIAQNIELHDESSIQDLVGDHGSKYSKVYLISHCHGGHWVALTKTHYIDGESVYNVLNWVLADYFLRTINDRDNVLNDGGKWPKLFAYRCLLSNCPKYALSPSLHRLIHMSEDELSSVKNFKICRKGMGKIVWLEEVDLRGVDLNLTVTIDRKAVELHPDKSTEGVQLNKPARITMYSVLNKNMGYETLLGILKKRCEEKGHKFLSYRENGEFRFTVDKFV
jgi:hypothetical protein